MQGLLRELQHQLGLSMIFVTHDISVGVEVADRIAVMYAGRIVEIGNVRDVIRSPRHPYTIGLMSTRPHGGRLLGNRLPAIPGSPPDLANLRNAKNLVDLLKQARNNDSPPHLVINMQGMPKRPEIPVKDFEAALDMKAMAVIEFDSESFGQAANNGQMVEEMNAKAKCVPQFRDLAMALAGRRQHKVEKKSPLAPLLERFGIKR